MNECWGLDRNQTACLTPGSYKTASPEWTRGIATAEEDVSGWQSNWSDFDRSEDRCRTVIMRIHHSLTEFGRELGAKWTSRRNNSAHEYSLDSRFVAVTLAQQQPIYATSNRSTKLCTFLASFLRWSRPGKWIDCDISWPTRQLVMRLFCRAATARKVSMTAMQIQF